MSDLRLTPEQLAKHDGSTGLPIYIAIKGVIYDVSANSDMYIKGKAYNVFCGKDCSRALATSVLDPSQCIPDTEGLDAESLQTLDKWVEFYKKKYPVVGTVVY